MTTLAKSPGFGASGNARLSALRINDEPQFIRIVSRAIVVNRGHAQNAAEALGVHRNTIAKWIKHYDELRKIYAEAQSTEK